MIPRIRGRVGKGDDGKYYAEISLWELSGEKMIGDPFTIGPIETEGEAYEHLHEAVKRSCEAIEKAYGHEPSGQYLDLKNGAVLKPWVQH
jgi:hypothetical protein